MKHFSITCLLFAAVLAGCSTGKKDLPEKEEWIQLFNKKDLSGWDIKIAKHPLNDNFNNNSMSGTAY
jgi:hypothetical protein